MNSEIMRNIADNVEKVIIGKRRSIELVICSLVCRGHVLIEDVPGVGKTSLVSSVARSLACSFNRIQFTPDILPSDITGFSMYNQKTGEFEFRKGAVMSNIVLADEINRTSPKTQSSLLEVMEENQVTVDGVTYKAPKPFMVLATQNPVEYLGTHHLPEAQLDRFFMKITLGYPSAEEEAVMLERFRSETPMDSLKAVANAPLILQMQEDVTKIHVDKNLGDYIVSLVSHTRANPDVVLGASPRASLYLLKASQAWAMYNGREYVLPDDVQAMAESVLSHRLILRQDARLRKVTANDVVEAAIKNTQVPVV